MNDVKPFLGFSAPRPTRSFADALTSIDVPSAPSPWSVKPPVQPAFDTEAIFADAAERGREAGLAETAQLRAQLASLIEHLTAAQAATGPKLAELVADAACAVISAWAQPARKEVFTSIIHAWTQSALGVATAHVNPADAALLGEAMAVEIDASIKPGDIVLRGTTAELVHTWDERLAELRETIIASVEETT